jgi:hypothetical protein
VEGLEVTAIDGTTMELGRNDVLEGEFGTPAERARPVLRVTAHVRTATFRWTGAAIGGYHDGENALADQLEHSFRPGILNLADRGFFSMDRFLRFSGTGAHLAWRIKNSAKSAPLKTVTAQRAGRAVGKGVRDAPRPPGEATCRNISQMVTHLHRHHVVQHEEQLVPIGMHMQGRPHCP